MDLLFDLIVCYLFFLIPALNSDIVYDAVFIKREKELFNRSNYETECFHKETDYIGDMTKCNGLHINPKCV
uniref:Uncharacterized protein n=1 Tax=Magallana gigas TaxID=29159 RepID=A0A8W8MWL7_MAGGI